MISKERIFFLVDTILSKFENEKITIKDRKKVRSILIKGFTDEMKFFETIDAEAREKISRMRKTIPEGSGEWTALYEKFFDEEFKKRTRL